MATETAGRDPNYVSTIMGMDLSTGRLPTKVYVDETTHRLLVNATIVSTQTAGIVNASNLARANVTDQNTVITSSTAATTIVTADATHYLDLVSLVMANTSATGTEVQLFNDDGTTIRHYFYVPANDTRGIVFSVPFTQAATNVTWKLKTVTSIASLKVTAQFVLNS